MFAAASSALMQSQAPSLSRLVTIQDAQDANRNPEAGHTAERGRWLCSELEAGNILFYPTTPFEIPSADRESCWDKNKRVPHITRMLPIAPQKTALRAWANQKMRQRRGFGRS